MLNCHDIIAIKMFNVEASRSVRLGFRPSGFEAESDSTSEANPPPNHNKCWLWQGRSRRPSASSNGNGQHFTVLSVA